MPPNTVDIASPEDIESVSTQKVPPKPIDTAPEPKNSSTVGIFLSTLNAIVHILTGVIVGVTVIFALTMNPGPTPTHIILCTIGYQLLMAESILVLCPQNGWSSSLSLVNRRRVHWVCQIGGSVMVIAGSFVLTLIKPVNWNTLHGKFGEANYGLRTFQSSLVLLANILIGVTVGATLIFSFSGGLPLGPTPAHIVLCVLGYQLLMAQAILSLSPTNGWSLHLKFVDKRRAHWILQLAGSILAITGSFIKIIDKSIHWNTLHGQFALVALVFTVVSLVNGVTSLWAYEIRRFIPAYLSKLTHICFGIVGFAAASISLCYGLDKGSFKGWATEPMTNTIVAFTATFTFIIIINPMIVFFMKLKDTVK